MFVNSSAKPARSLALRSLRSAACVVALSGVLMGCADTGGTLPGLGTQPGGPGGASAGPTIGSGPVRVGLLLPLSAPNGAAPAQALRNAAEMAIAEFNSQELTILVKDDRGTPEGAQAAAREALSEGAEVIMGPLFAPSVQSVSAVAKAANRPVIAFSTDASVASPGVYLLSFMPQSDVRRIVSFAVARGKKSFAALIPQTAYGNVAEQAFMQAVTSSGMRLAMVERYQPNKASLDAAVAKIKAGAEQIDALFIADDGAGMPAVGAAIQAAGISTRTVQLLGPGVWNEPRVFRAPSLAGAWFAAPDNSGFQGFAQRYRARFNADPTRIATLSYDATALLSALVRTQQPNTRFSEATLTNASGFAGQDGVFRFRQDGTNDRGLAVFQIGGGGARVIQAAPQTFSGGGGS